MGSIMPWAAMMQTDIIAVANSLWARASFCPTSGSNGALAKWNSIAQHAYTSRGRRYHW